MVLRSRPLMLEAILDLASLEMRLDPKRTVGWLMLISAHPAAIQETKDRARHLLEVLKEQLDPQQMGAIREKASHQTLETVADILA